MQKFSVDAKTPTKCAMCGSKHQLWLFNGKAYCYDHAYVTIYDYITQCRHWSSVSKFVECLMLNDRCYLGFDSDAEYAYFVVKTLLRVTSLLVKRGFAEPQSLLTRDMLLLTSWFGSHLQHALLRTVDEKHYSPIINEILSGDTYDDVDSTWVNQNIVNKLRGLFAKVPNLQFHGGIGSQKLSSVHLPQVHDKLCLGRPICVAYGNKFAFPLNTATAKLCREAERRGQIIQGGIRYANSINEIF